MQWHFIYFTCQVCSPSLLLINFPWWNPVISIGFYAIRNFVWGQKISPCMQISTGSSSKILFDLTMLLGLKVISEWAGFHWSIRYTDRNLMRTHLKCLNAFWPILVWKHGVTQCFFIGNVICQILGYFNNNFHEKPKPRVRQDNTFYLKS